VKEALNLSLKILGYLWATGEVEINGNHYRSKNSHISSIYLIYIEK